MAVEQADRKFVWTPEGRILSARAAVLTRQARRGTISGEEALILTLYPPKDARFEALVERELEYVPHTRTSRARRGTKPVEARNKEHRARERDRYHNDPEYRERRLAQFKARRSDPEWRAKDAERKRLARAAAKQAKP